ncbi:hypothetical protein, partial [Escherichia coli]|uniref:hypothetical protein n=1 Tax=Escherichia coli TaxID=562 RepID=UPI00193E4015
MAILNPLSNMNAIPRELNALRTPHSSNSGLTDQKINPSSIITVAISQAINCRLFTLVKGCK